MNIMKKIDDYLADLPTWQKEYLTTFRKLVHEVEPAITEDWKWNVPFFMLNDEMLFAISSFKSHTKYNFLLNGARLKDENNLFNNGFDSQKTRAIDRREGEKISIAKLRALITESVRLAKL